jgi:tellurite resistance protein TerC
MYVFGAVVLVSGLFMLGGGKKETPPRWLQWLLRNLPTAATESGSSFFVRTQFGLRMTSLFVALIAIEITDVAFALDSIPAVLAISRHTFVVYTSNILAVLSLRSLFPAVVEAMRRFHRLHVGVAVILIFVGCKMLASEKFGIGPLASVAVIAAIMAAAIAMSLLQPEKAGV